MPQGADDCRTVVVPLTKVKAPARETCKVLFNIRRLPQTMINLEPATATGLPLLRLGFRPFFLGAGIFAVVSMLVWMLVYAFGLDLNPAGLMPVTWHAHEMIFGYAMAVIAGFLLTAIKNWTGQQTIRGAGLFVLFALWVAARMLALTQGDLSVVLMAAADLSFMLTLVIAASLPVLRVRQYAQAGILSKLALLLASNALFYLGVFEIVASGEQWGLYSGLYLVVALLLVMARRVIPFFIEKGIGEGAVVKNWKWVDNSSLVLLLMLMAVDVFTGYDMVASMLAAALFFVHTVRLSGWYTHRLWRRPLLWVLYVAYGFVVAGFLLKAAEPWFNVSPFLFVHAFAYGGIGIMTIGMMSRVILGHTGRDVLHPPAVLGICFMLLTGGAVARVLLPLIAPGLYNAWLVMSQLLWIAAFLLFLLVYTPMLLRTRIDGRDG